MRGNGYLGSVHVSSLLSVPTRICVCPFNFERKKMINIQGEWPLASFKINNKKKNVSDFKNIVGKWN